MPYHLDELSKFQILNILKTFFDYHELINTSISNKSKSKVEKASIYLAVGGYPDNSFKIHDIMN